MKLTFLVPIILSASVLPGAAMDGVELAKRQAKTDYTMFPRHSQRSWSTNQLRLGDRRNCTVVPHILWFPVFGVCVWFENANRPTPRVFLETFVSLLPNAKKEGGTSSWFKGKDRGP